MGYQKQREEKHKEAKSNVGDIKKKVKIEAKKQKGVKRSRGVKKGRVRGKNKRQVCEQN